LLRVHARRHLKESEVCRLAIDDTKPPQSLKNITGLNKETRRLEILMAIFEDSNDSLSIVRLFENLKKPEDNEQFDVDMRLDDRSSTPLHWAASCGRLSLVHALLATGANATTYSYGGETPLMRAVYSNRNYTNRSFSQLVTLLKPSVYSLDSHSRSILHHIAILSQVESKRAVSSYYFEAVADFISKARQITRDSLEILKDETEYCDSETKFVDFINAQDQFKETALHIACRYKNYRIVDILLKLGASSQIANDAGETFQW
jgi:regulatory protein SWI6